MRSPSYLCAQNRIKLSTVKPYQDQDSSKRTQVESMFDSIAFKYDFLNTLLSGGIDNYWRKKAIEQLSHLEDNSKVLDVATGTGVLSIKAAKRFSKLNFIGVDISQKMLDFAANRIQKLQLEKQISLKNMDSCKLEFPENSLDCVMVAFGVRNFENLDQGLKEMHRVLKKGEKIIILEFTMPRKSPIKQIYHFYFKNILPVIGKLYSKDPRAYQYLFESVQQFPDYERFTQVLQKNGFANCSFESLSFGVCCLYIGYKS